LLYGIHSILYRKLPRVPDSNMAVDFWSWRIWRHAEYMAACLTGCRAEFELHPSKTGL
jgi:hypothetical protein